MLQIGCLPDLAHLTDALLDCFCSPYSLCLGSGHHDIGVKLVILLLIDKHACSISKGRKIVIPILMKR